VTVPSQTELPRPSGLVAQVKEFGAVLGVAAAALYASGFIVVNTFYGSWGVPPTFAGARCLAAAVLPGGSVLVATILASWMIRSDNTLFFRAVKGYMAGYITCVLVVLGSAMHLGFSRPRFSLLGWLFTVFLLLSSVGVLIVTRKGEAPATFSRLLYKRFGWGAFWVTALLLCYVVVRQLGLMGYGGPTQAVLVYSFCAAGAGVGALWPSIRRVSQRPSSPRGTAAVFMAAVVLVLSSLYGRFVYPKVPATLGGGRPTLLLSTPAEIGLASPVWVDDTATSAATSAVKVYLIDVVGPFVLLSVQEGNEPACAIAVNRDLVHRLEFRRNPLFRVESSSPDRSK
jgi:hypothetical protein